jgi:hypothetical protein
VDDCRRLVQLQFCLLQEANQQHGSTTDVGTADIATHGSTATSTTRPKPLTMVKTFSWQEKVYSKAELVAAQV